MLTTKDLTKIRSAIKEEVEDIFDKKLEIRFKENNKLLATKKDFEVLNQKIMDLQDIVIGIRNELDTEHEIRLFQIDKNTELVTNHEVRIQRLEKPAKSTT